MNQSKGILFFIITILLFSCNKEELLSSQTSDETNPENNFFGRVNQASTTPFCYDCQAQTNFYQDTIDQQTLLGATQLNPYTLPNMTQAYFNIYGVNPSPALSATHYYVKFSPSSLEQLALLEDEDIDLNEFPLDREIVFEGDYYVEPGKDIEDLPNLYAVVPKTYIFPAGVPYTILESMNIPDNVPEWEDEALYLTNNLAEDDYVADNKDGDTSYLQTRAKTIARLPQPPCDIVINPNSGTPDPCNTGGGGGTGGGTGGYRDCRRYPEGKILVQNELTGNTGYRGVRNVRVVVRRGFKTQRLFTNNDGLFVTTKYFRNKYTILIKFKNANARIARMRSLRLWEQYFPIKINFGTWKNLACGTEFKINHPEQTEKINTSHWCAAITHNSIIEHRELSIQEGVGVPPQGLHILLSRKKAATSGNTLMYDKMKKSGGIVPSDLVIYGASYVPIAGPILSAVLLVWQQRAPDILFGYGNGKNDINKYEFLKTDQYSELVYHELTHAAHYNKVGNSWWREFGLDEGINGFGNPGYGPCCNSRSEKIAIGEGWAYHFGHYLADLKWGSQSTSFIEQGNRDYPSQCLNFTNGNGYSSHHNFLENYNPNRDVLLDPDNWLPKGLFNDMMDIGESTQSSVVDNVSGFNNFQLFQAIDNNVNSMDDYKAKIFLYSNFNQQSQINELFSQYGY